MEKEMSILEKGQIGIHFYNIYSILHFHASCIFFLYLYFALFFILLFKSFYSFSLNLFLCCCNIQISPWISSNKFYLKLTDQRQKRLNVLYNRKHVSLNPYSFFVELFVLELLKCANQYSVGLHIYTMFIFLPVQSVTISGVKQNWN